MSRTRIVVLANSWKHKAYCLAGIELSTGKWVRPVTELETGKIERRQMRLGGYFPKLLDVIELPLDSTGPDYGFESENRSLLPGKWFRRGRLTIQNLEQYVESPPYLLHNQEKYVRVGELQSKPFHERITLQLIRVNGFDVKNAGTPNNPNWKGLVRSGERLLEIPITDPVYSERLTGRHAPARSCLLTMSLGMPYKPPGWTEEGEPVCWKLIAGVIELAEDQPKGIDQ